MPSTMPAKQRRKAPTSPANDAKLVSFPSAASKPVPDPLEETLTPFRPHAFYLRQQIHKARTLFEAQSIGIAALDDLDKAFAWLRGYAIPDPETSGFCWRKAVKKARTLEAMQQAAWEAVAELERVRNYVREEGGGASGFSRTLESIEEFQNLPLTPWQRFSKIYLESEEGEVSWDDKPEHTRADFY